MHMPETIDARIFSGISLTSFSFTPASGSYVLRDEKGQTLMRLEKFQQLSVQLNPRGIYVSAKDSIFFVEGSLSLEGKRLENFFFVRPHQSAESYRVYDDFLLVYPGEEELILVNRVGYDNYLAGVVESESGFNRHPEFYKVQTILARTYALENSRRQVHSGYDVCDQVHCQAYYGRSRYPAIMQAVFHTYGDVVADPHNRLISAVYHANCGGETVASGDLWPNHLPYLQRVEDPYCLESPGARWEATIAKDSLLSFLNDQYGINPPPAQTKALQRFSQPARLLSLDQEGLITLRSIREHFRLRSTFFSYETRNDSLHISGRGYGHGVGLCQEGAMQMAMQGYSKDQIIGFYYKGVRIINLEVIPFEFMPW